MRPPTSAPEATSGDTCPQEASSRHCSGHREDRGERNGGILPSRSDSPLRQGGMLDTHAHTHTHSHTHSHDAGLQHVPLEKRENYTEGADRGARPLHLPGGAQVLQAGAAVHEGGSWCLRRAMLGADGRRLAPRPAPPASASILVGNESPTGLRGSRITSATAPPTSRRPHTARGPEGRAIPPALPASEGR